LDWPKKVRISKAYLFSALDNIKWADGSVSKTAGQNSTGHTFGVITKIVNVTHFYAFLVQNLFAFKDNNNKATRNLKLI
jgi:hypothetical protein